MDNIGMSLNNQDAKDSSVKSEKLLNNPLQPKLPEFLTEKNPNFSQIKVEETLLLKKKRESDSHLEKNQNETIENRSTITQGINERDKCQICSGSDWRELNIKISCKLCNQSFHMDCARNSAEGFINNEYICNLCRTNYLKRVNQGLPSFGSTEVNQLRDILNQQKLPINKDKNINLFNYLSTNFNQTMPNQNIFMNPGVQNPQERLTAFNNPQNSLLNQYLQNIFKQINEKPAINMNFNPIGGMGQYNPLLTTNPLLMNHNILKGPVLNNWAANIVNSVGGQNHNPSNNNITNVNLINNLINCVNYQNFQKEPRDVNRNIIPNFLNNNTQKLINSFVQMHHGKSMQEEKVQKILEQEKQPLLEDSLLRKNPDLYGIDIESFERPEFIKLTTPKNFQSKIFLIWDYLLTFGNEFWTEYPQYNDTKFEVDKIYDHLNDMNSLFFKDLTIYLTSPYLNYSLSCENEEFSIHKELLLMKTLKENINSDQKLIFNRISLEIIKLLINSKKFSLLADENIKNISKLISKGETLNLNDKISITLFMINSSFDLPILKNHINREMIKKNEILREKSIIQSDYKMKDQRKKEIEKNEKFVQAESRIEVINRKLLELEKNKNSIPGNIFSKKKKEYLLEMDRLKSLLKEYDEINVVKEKILNRLKDMKTALVNFPATSSRLIGQDVDKNEYFYFEGSDRLFVRVISEDKKKEYRYYSDIQDIEEFVNTKLIEKGIREKNLKRNLLKILPKIYECKNNAGVIKEILLEEKTTENLLLAVDIIKKIDEKFSEYLTSYNKQWEEISLRNKWKEIITESPTLNNLAQSLKMLNLRFKNPYRTDEPLVSDHEDPGNDVDIPSYVFSSENQKLVIFEYDQRKVLAPKVKIWSRELESYDMEKYYGEHILKNINSNNSLYLALHFYESVIFSLIKRRETIGKKNSNLIREINDLEMVNEVQSETSQHDQEKTVSVMEMDVEKTESINPSANSSEKKPIPELKQSKIIQPRVLKRKRNLNNKKWEETCYVCGDYGELICCDGCPNVAHLFCACLEISPDQWFCENCIIQKDKSKKKNK